MVALRISQSPTKIEVVMFTQMKCGAKKKKSMLMTRLIPFSVQNFKNYAT
jgi:hypothetical protein